jgi:hypothetical protein
MESTWEQRDLPVLKAIVELTEEGLPHVARADVTERTGLDDDVVRAAYFALYGEQPPFCKFSDLSTLAGSDIDWARDPTGHARRTAGGWPTSESLADRIVAAFDDAARQTHDPEERARLIRAAEAVGGIGKGVVTGVLTKVLTEGV